ncbi:hypothetical protein RB608_11785 [Nocardioides sp. LHD-245]|uniref:hypothetical protein n=1 Tax=Nocardioides sp. LHD-245 TaxID=3051387 RepID=UPI0027E0D8C3|nr:hypothetical protein [Nocardioides sp. LHD-245]
MTATTPTVACDQCRGRLVYRVKCEDFPAEADNFDQVVDHRPVVFTSQHWLTTVAENREGKVTVWRLADADQGGDFAEAERLLDAAATPPIVLVHDKAVTAAQAKELKDQFEAATGKTPVVVVGASVDLTATLLAAQAHATLALAAATVETAYAVATSGEDEGIRQDWVEVTQ